MTGRIVRMVEVPYDPTIRLGDHIDIGINGVRRVYNVDGIHHQQGSLGRTTALQLRLVSDSHV